MIKANPKLIKNSCIEVIDSKTIFQEERITQKKAPSIIRLSNGKILLTYSVTENLDSLESWVVITDSEDNGESWSEPRTVYSLPEWTCLNMGGLVKFSDQMIRLIVGRINIDYSLGGDEPFDDCFTGFIDSKDGGQTWSKNWTEISLFPAWTEVYGQSNPHLLNNGQFLMATMGTMGRDVQWHAGVSFCDPSNNYEFSKPVIIANDPERHYSDIDVVRLNDSRLLAVIREHNLKKTVYSHSSDEGKTWTPIRYTGFLGSNVKLHKLNSGALICAYRDEDPDNRGVSLSISFNNGETWEQIGQLYSAKQDSRHIPNLKCGYPDFVNIYNDKLLGILHTYPDEEGRIDLQQFCLKDLT